MAGMQTVGEVIEALGGYVAVAKALGIQPTSVRNWPARNAFPPNQYVALSNLARRRKVSISRKLFRVVHETKPRTNSAQELRDIT